MILSIYLNSKGCWHLKIYLSNVCTSNIGWKGNKLQLFAQFALSRFLLCKHKYSNAQSRKRNYGLFLCRHTANSQGYRSVLHLVKCTWYHHTKIWLCEFFCPQSNVDFHFQSILNKLLNTLCKLSIFIFLFINDSRSCQCLWIFYLFLSRLAKYNSCSP